MGANPPHDNLLPAVSARSTAHIREFAWADTALGPLAGWPDDLLVAVGMVLDNPFPQLLLWGPEFIVCAYNDAYRSILAEKPEALGRRVTDVWPEAQQAIEPALRAAWGGEASRVADGRFKLLRHGSSETAYFDYAFSPVRDRTGAVFSVLNTVVETTGKVLAEQELRASSRRKDEFLAMLSHELRNPLAPVRTGLDLLQDLTTDRRAEVLPMMDRQLSHLVRLVDDLLDVTRINHGTLALQQSGVALQEAVQAAIEQVSTLVQRRRHELIIRHEAAPLLVQGDFERLVQVFANLLANAARFTPPGGRIQIQSERHADQAVIRVRDDGDGIAPDQLDGVFELFSQMPKHRGLSNGGLGIGLSLSRQLVEMHDGSIEANSAGDGRGSEFIVRLPVRAAPQ